MHLKRASRPDVLTSSRLGIYRHTHGQGPLCGFLLDASLQVSNLPAHSIDMIGQDGREMVPDLRVEVLTGVGALLGAAVTADAPCKQLCHD